MQLIEIIGFVVFQLITISYVKSDKFCDDLNINTTECHCFIEYHNNHSISCVGDNITETGLNRFSNISENFFSLYIINTSLIEISENLFNSSSFERIIIRNNFFLESIAVGAFNKSTNLILLEVVNNPMLDKESVDGLEGMKQPQNAPLLETIFASDERGCSAKCNDTGCTITCHISICSHNGECVGPVSFENMSCVCECNKGYTGQRCHQVDHCVIKTKMPDNTYRIGNEYCKQFGEVDCLPIDKKFICKCNDSSFWNPNTMKCELKSSLCPVVNDCSQFCFNDDKSENKARCECTKLYELMGNRCVLKENKSCNCKDPSFCNDDGQCICKHGYNLDVDELGKINGCKINK